MKFLLTALTCLALLVPNFAFAKGGHAPAHRASRSAGKSKSKNKSAGVSKKSNVAGSRDGKYVGAGGSSHKGGKYVNPKTQNHDRNRKAGVPE
jgi:hypothetical protein